MRTALLVIDVQQLLTSGPEAAHDAERVVDRINTVARAAREAGAPVILIQHEDRGPLAFGSAGWQLDPRLVVQPQDLPLRKTATDSFHKTDLQALLQARGIDRLVVCGLQSDFCVDTTTRRALALGYPVVLVADGHSTIDNAVLTAPQISAHHATTLANIQSFGPRVTLANAADVRFAV
jgi:nicotinamidase-related amidase